MIIVLASMCGQMIKYCSIMERKHDGTVRLMEMHVLGWHEFEVGVF